MTRLATIATCNLNQWAMDFQGNLKRIQQSIVEAKEKGARYRVGPELEITGYSCEDHFLEPDTFQHSWEVVAELIASGVTEDILESRWFRAWKRRSVLEQYKLPEVIVNITGQTTCPFGEAVIEVEDTSLAVETCEELFTVDSPHIKYVLNGVEILANGSGSHHHLRKLDQRLSLIRGATSKGGGVYLYSNQLGCDGGRLYFDGCACICVNGELVAQGSQFSLETEVEVIVGVVDLDEVTSHRVALASLGVQAAEMEDITRITLAGFYLCSSLDNSVVNTVPSQPIQVRIHHPMEEIALGPACWLWDYLRRSGAAGFFLPLSGGADSSSTAAIVGNIRRVCGEPHDSKERSKVLAKDIGAYHLDIHLDIVVDAMVKLFCLVFGEDKEPRFKVYGGSETENLALQNIQARIRMVIAYFFAQMLPFIRGRKGGALLVLGSANVDEGLRGYLTKYDCSSADINPIGGISKVDLKAFLSFAAKPLEENGLGYASLKSVTEAPPTAELEPITASYTQTDEADMGMTYEELTWYGRLRKLSRCGPVSMFCKLSKVWKHLSYTQVADKVKFFFQDNRYDLRPFLYNIRWQWQFSKIDQLECQVDKRNRLFVHLFMSTFPTSKLTENNGNGIVLVNCGSFSPITLAHLILMESAYNFAHYSGLQVLGGYLSPVHDSYNKPGLITNSWECCRSEYSPTFLVVEHFRSQLDLVYGVNIQLAFVCGSDLYRSLFNSDIWPKNHVERLLDMASLFVIPRMEDLSKSRVEKQVKAYLPGYQDKVFIVDQAPLCQISSTMVRDTLRKGGSIKYMVPDSVFSFYVDPFSRREDFEQNNGLDQYLSFCRSRLFMYCFSFSSSYGGFFFVPASKAEKTKALVVGKLGETVKYLASGSHYLPTKAKSWLQVANNGYAVLLELVGVGFRAQEEEDRIVLRVGFTHPVYLPKEKDGVQYHVLNQTLLSVVGIDEKQVRHAAGRVRLIRPPDPYKGKGIRYLLEEVRLKEGKKK
ncbi:Glutamine-dependent NAD(+) synthetase [Galdieria sulphuraria]|nr:Glutamine-dependent NAD(+) synthetase [Galdieria sulphuraria]